MAADDNPVIFVPGIMGSTLKHEGRNVWGEGRFEVEALKYPVLSLTPHNILKSVTVFPLAINVYGEFLTFLESNLHYTMGRNLFVYPYDWRLHCTHSAELLKRKVLEWAKLLKNPEAKFTIIAHSMGGLVARHCVRLDGVQKHVKQIIAAGVPHRGTPLACRALIHGVDLPGKLPGGHSERVISVIRSLPSVYHLLPTLHPYLRWGTRDRSTQVNLSNTASWKWLHEGRGKSDDSQLHHSEAVRAHHTLSTSQEPVPVFSIYSRHQRTLQTITIPYNRSGGLALSEAMYDEPVCGDGLVPYTSATFDLNVINCEVNRRHESLLDDPLARTYVQELLTGAIPQPSAYLQAGGRRLHLDLAGDRNSPPRGPYTPGSTLTLELGLVDEDGQVAPGVEFQVEVYLYNDQGMRTAKYTDPALERPQASGPGSFEARPFTAPSELGLYKVIVTPFAGFDIPALHNVLSFRVGTPL